MRHGSKTVFNDATFLGMVSGGAFPDASVAGMDLRPLPGLYVDGVLSDYDVLTAIGSIAGVSTNNPREILIGVSPRFRRVSLSIDGGVSWTFVHSSADPNWSEDNHFDIIGGRDAGGVGECLVCADDGVFAYGNLSDVYVGGTATALAYPTEQTIGDVVTAGTSDVTGVSVRGVIDAVAGYRWVGGANGTAKASVASKPISTACVGTATGWTQVQVHADSAYVKSMAAGKGPAASFGGRALVLVDGLNRYYTQLYNGGSGAPGTWTQVSLSGIMTANVRYVAYNAFWDRYIFIPHTLTEGVTMGSVPSALLGSTDAAHYSVWGLHDELVGSQVTHPGTGAVVTVGPWTYVQSSKSFASSAVLGTPDCGRTWYRSDLKQLSGSTDEVSNITSMCAHRGRLYVVVTSSLTADSATERTQLFCTPQLEPTGLIFTAA